MGLTSLFIGNGDKGEDSWLRCSAGELEGVEVGDDAADEDVMIAAWELWWLLFECELWWVSLETKDSMLKQLDLLGCCVDGGGWAGCCWNTSTADMVTS